MLKILNNAVLILLLIFLVGCGIYDLNFFTVPDDLEFLAVVEKLDTPEKISDYMVNNFEYEVYDFTAQSPYELFLSQRGDCDEFAKFGVFIADYHGYETFTIRIFDGSFYNHLVTVYNEDIWYSITDNQYYYFGFDTFREIVEDVCYRRLKVWTKYIVYDYWDNEIEIKYNISEKGGY